MEPENGQSPKKERRKEEKKSDPKSQYQTIQCLGRGAFGQVFLVKRKGRLYAMKQIQKKLLEKQQKQYQAFIEKELLMKIKHPGIVRLQKCFQDKKILYFILEFCGGGDLTKFIQQNAHRMTEQLRKFYIAEIVVILQYIHQLGIVHRDLKPQNIMLTENGHLKLIDFGTSDITQCTIVNEEFKAQMERKKREIQSRAMEEEMEQEFLDFTSDSPKKRKATFVGTSCYISPELLEKNICVAPSDLWALGCIIYQLYYKKTPFEAGQQFIVFENITNLNMSFPNNEQITKQAIDLIRKLIVKDPLKRLGSGSQEGLMFSDLKSHPFFKQINFQNIFSQQIPQLRQKKLQGKELQERKSQIQKSSSSIRSQNSSILQNNPNILFQGMVEKRTFVSYNLYYLVVFQNLEIIRIKNQEPDKKRQMKIPLDKKLQDPAALVSENKFKLITSEKTYSLRSQEAQRWVDTINKRYHELLSDV